MNRLSYVRFWDETYSAYVQVVKIVRGHINEPQWAPMPPKIARKSEAKGIAKKRARELNCG